MSKAAKIVRRDTLNLKKKFSGNFEKDCQKESTPYLLQCLVSMILRGSNIKSNVEDIPDSQLTHTISQLLQFNCTSRRNTPRNRSQDNHNALREPPLPTYVGLFVHAKTRKKSLVDELFRLGLSISYNRVNDITTNIGSKAHFADKQVVCPLNLKKNLFTTAAIDNIDHNPSSATTSDSLHGTGISLFQHRTQEEEGGIKRRPNTL